MPICRFAHLHISRFIIALTFLTTLACIGTGGSTLPVDEAAPDFGIRVRGKTTALTDYRGQVVLVSFWAST